MKTKSTNRFVSLALALIMLMTCVSFSPLAMRASAEGADSSKYVFDVGDLELVAKGAKNGKTESAGTDEYFTVCYGDSNAQVVENATGFEGGYTSTKRLDFGGATSDSQFSGRKRVIEFTTSGKASVTVWWQCGTSDGRYVALYNADTKDFIYSDDINVALDTTENKNKADTTKDKTYISTYELDAAGTYRIGCGYNTCYLFKVEVTESAAGTDTPVETKDYTLEAKDLETIASTSGSTQEGTATEDGKYFTVNWGEKGRVLDGKNVSYEDGYTSTKWIDFNGGTSSAPTRTIQFTAGDSGILKIWWGNDGSAERGLQVYKLDGAAATAITDAYFKTAGKSTKYDEFEIEAGNTYCIGGPDGTIYFTKIVVTEGKLPEAPTRPEWSQVAAPTIGEITQDGGTIKVPVTADVGNNGGDKIAVVMTDANGNELDSAASTVKDKGNYTLEFSSAKNSGTYKFKAVLSRKDETDVKESAEKEFTFLLPLDKPTISSATSKGNGSVELEWSAVKEATSYIIYCDGEEVGTATETKFMVTGLTVGQTYSFTVKAVRDGVPAEKASDAKTATVAEQAQQTWSFMWFGTSTSKTKNYYEGELNEDGKVTVVAKGGGGKFLYQEPGGEGVSFYYTAIPTNVNFTLRAKMKIDERKLNISQEGAGIMAMDSLPETPFDSSYKHTTNLYRVGAQQLKYYYDENRGVVFDTSADSYNMQIGLGTNAKTGATASDKSNMLLENATLETIAADKGYDSGTYCTIGGDPNPGKNVIAEIDEMILELQRNNTGYFLSYYTVDGELVKTQKYYDPKALDVLDSDFVYVGFTAAREVTATFSDVTLTTIAPEKDAPAEAKPITEITPTVSVGSATSANSTKYTLLLKSNVSGKVKVISNSTTVAEDVVLDGSINYVSIEFAIVVGNNKIEIIFTPDEEQASFDEFTKLTSTADVTKTIMVRLDDVAKDQKNLYVSPSGSSSGSGTKDDPFDVYTAVNIAKPGQTIILMEGRYNLTKNLLIDRGMNGTSENPIRMISDPDAKSRPVFDLQGISTMTAAGDYWYFYGFDVTNSVKAGLVVAGNHSTFELINAYSNEDTGIYIHAKNNSNDPRSLWPSYNLILNCTSYDNADAITGGGNADGFAAKLTVGEGNVFDGCVAYNNSDDGWDLFAKESSGPIGAVTIRNCIAYNNGKNLDGSLVGDGNGFKMGGSGIPGEHKIYDSVAFNNDNNGIDCNSSPNIQVYRCTSYNNGNYNIRLETTSSYADPTAYVVDGLVSFRFEKARATGVNDKVDPKNGQTLSVLESVINYYWSKGNSNGETLSADMFKDLDFNGYERSADGKIDLKGFLALSDKAPQALTSIFKALDGNYTTYDYASDPNYVLTSGSAVEPDPENPSSGNGGDSGSGSGSGSGSTTKPAETAPPTGFGVEIVVAVLAVSAAAAIVLFTKKRRSSK
ncbi:MAG: right-handed parallel beta-helix repeat-containing protein [Oscillospiraceae bacterium]|nr:right-handed parallel beta-helix repeat-containing protein [Oscillospiraceae bacterium]